MGLNVIFGMPQAANNNQAPPDDGLFYRSIRSDMGQKTASRVLNVFNALFDLPVPNEGEFLQGTEGVLVFSNILGIVIRVEQKDPKKGYRPFSRENDNPFILQPLASLSVEDCIIEICPGTYLGNKTASNQLDHLLEQMGINPWDVAPRNCGFLPHPGSKEPSDFPVVIDRLAVNRLTEGALSIQEALTERNLTEDPQKALYTGLKAAFNKALSAPTTTAQKQGFRDCWQLCAQKTQEGVLVAGWGEERMDDRFGKTGDAARYSKKYDQRSALQGIAEREREREREATKAEKIVAYYQQPRSHDCAF